MRLITSLTLAALVPGALAPGALAAPPGSAALDSPNCVRLPEARAEQPGDEELGVGRGGEYCAYPLRMMAYHRVVNDHLGGPPILVTYDPDAAAGRVFDPVVAGKTLTFDALPSEKGLPRLKDRETGSTWSAITGEATAGPMAGKKLALIPSLVLTWERWKALHGDSWVLAEIPGAGPHYVSRTTAGAPAAGVPASDDSRLAPARLVLGVATEAGAAAVPLTDAKGGYGEKPGTVPLPLASGRVLFTDPAARAAAAYVPVAKGRRLTFTARAQPEGPAWTDRETGSTWNLEGRCVDGALKGETLAPVDAVRTRWYAWAALHPTTTVARPGR